MLLQKGCPPQEGAVSSVSSGEKAAPHFALQSQTMSGVTARNGVQSKTRSARMPRGEITKAASFLSHVKSMRVILYILFSFSSLSFFYWKNLTFKVMFINHGSLCPLLLVFGCVCVCVWTFQRINRGRQCDF